MVKGWLQAPEIVDGREATAADQVAAVIAAWDEGLLANAEVATKLVDLLTATNVDEVWAATPERWRGDLMGHLRGLASDAELISVGGVLYAYELERDPVR